jgi:hypothetical protein
MGHLVLAAHQTGLAIVDVSDPIAPQVLADDENISAVAVAGASRRAYVVAADGNLHLVDLSNPTTPRETAQIQVAKSQVIGVAAHTVLADHNLYVSIASETPQIIDVANPYRPQMIGPIGDREATVWAANTDYAYVSEKPRFPQGERGPKIGGGIDVVDVSDPANPAVVGTFETGAASHGSTLVDATFYTSDGETLRMIDVADPAQPALLGVIPLSGFALAAQGHVAVVASPGGLYIPNGFHILDLSEPANPVVVAFPRILSGGYHLAVRGITPMSAVSRASSPWTCPIQVSHDR